MPTHHGPELFHSTPATGVDGREMHHPGTLVSVGRDQHLALGGTLASHSGM